ANSGGTVLLNERIRDAYESRATEFERAGARISARAQDDAGAGFTAAPRLLEVDLPGLTAEIADECFGPLMVVVRYHDAAELDAALGAVPPSLTGSVHRGSGDD